MSSPSPHGPRVRVGAVGDISPGTCVRVDIGGSNVAVARVEDDFYAVADRCSHANYSLSEGDVDAGELTIECWKHGAQFSLCTGEALTLPAIMPVATYEVSVEADEVFVVLPSRGPS